MRTCAFTDSKGGSGKSASSVNIAAALVRSGRRVLLVDLDEQQTATNHLGKQDTGEGLLRAICGDIDPVTVVTEAASGIDLMPCGVSFLAFSKATAGVVEQDFLLRDMLAKLPEQRWDYVFLDCPGDLGDVTNNALVAADGFVVPVALATNNLPPLGRIFELGRIIRERLNARLRPYGIVGFRLDKRANLSRDVLVMLKQTYGPLVFDTCVPENTVAAEAFGFGVPVTDYAPNASSSIAYTAIAAELEARIANVETSPTGEDHRSVANG